MYRNAEKHALELSKMLSQVNRNLSSECAKSALCEKQSASAHIISCLRYVCPYMCVSILSMLCFSNVLSCVIGAICAQMYTLCMESCVSTTTVSAHEHSVVGHVHSS
jgi:hypothetical protein